MTPDGTAQTPLYELRDVSVTYGDIVALTGIDLTISAGERVALVGPSGAGKSTLLGLLNGTVRAADGSLRFLGSAVLDTDAWRGTYGRRIGTVYQQLHLVGPLRVVHNVNAGRLAEWSTLRALWSLLRPQGVDGVREVLDQVGIGDLLTKRTDRLSGGQQQRVAIARVLLQNPDVILADEPIASLDPARATEVLQLLSGLASNGDRALVVSLHAFDLAMRHCDRVIGLRDGAMVFDAAPAEITSSMAEALYRIASTRFAEPR